MNYLAIYRKYRPTNFDEVSGQKVVTDILKNSIKTNKIAHAYLFTGPRGTGKTSVAKIFARTINCENTETTNPCNKCISCSHSQSKECVDIIEIDAASNNGVDEIRELKSKVNIVPSSLKYKIYIIDEVHMLSIGAFNALLKTLEEPPAHVIFILATTELHKVPSTILSRCQILEFKKISATDMRNRINEICKKEKITISEAAIQEIIFVSDGCMRDALTLLEKLNTFCDGSISDKDVRNVCGKVPKNMISNVIQLLLDADITKLIQAINDLYNQDFEMMYIVEDVINELDKMIFDNSYNNKTNVCTVLSKLIDIYDKMKNSSVNKKIIFEIGILDLGRFTEENVNKNISREIILDTKPTLKQENPVIINPQDQKKVTESELKSSSAFDFEKFKKTRMNNVFVSASKESLNQVKDKWEKLKEYAFDKSNGAMICNLLDGIPIVANETYIALSYQYSSIADKVNEEYNKFEDLLEKYLSINHKIVAVSSEEWKKLKKQYIENMNNLTKYQQMDDLYINNKQQKKDVIVLTRNDKNREEIEAKAYELFDNEVIEIK